MVRIRVYPHRCPPALLTKLGHTGEPDKAPFTIEAEVDAKVFAEVKATKGALSQVLDDATVAKAKAHGGKDLAGAATQLEEPKADGGKKEPIDGDELPAATQGGYGGKQRK